MQKCAAIGKEQLGLGKTVKLDPESSRLWFYEDPSPESEESSI